MLFHVTFYTFYFISPLDITGVLINFTDFIF